MLSMDVTGLLGAVADVTGRFDVRLNQMKAAASRMGMPVRCTGCRQAGCCYQPVVTFIAEALYIASQHPIPSEQRASLIEAGNVMESMDKSAYFAKAIPCHFLAPDKSCTIYENRPSACRRYLVINEPRLCMPGSSEKVSVLNTIDLDNVWVTLMVRFQMKYLGVPLEPIMLGALPKMVAIASTVLDLAARDARRYLRDQKWLSFDQPMAQIDAEIMAEYSKRIKE